MADECTYTERAYTKLRHLCDTRIYNKYTNNCADAYKRMQKELKYVKGNGSAPLLVEVYEALNCVEAGSGQYCLCGVEGSSVISYILGFSEIDPINCSPRLYSEFCFGMDGNKNLAIELNVTKQLYEKLVRYFEHYVGEAEIKHRHFDDGKLFGIKIFDPVSWEKAKKDDEDGFSFVFKVVEADDMKNHVLSGEVFDAVKPVTYEERIHCLGLSRGLGLNGVWEENAEELFLSGKVKFENLIAHREDVYEFLLKYGVDKKNAYRIADDVKLGRVRAKGWTSDTMEVINNANIPDWFIKSCEKIKYLFPRAHDMMVIHHYYRR